VNFVAAKSVGILLAPRCLRVREDTLQDAYQLATDDGSGMISMNLQWHRAAAIGFNRIADSFRLERAI
jgi:hypothetical protein